MSTVFQCAVHLTNGAVLQAENVSASRDRIIDWRTVKSGATMLENADAFDVATLFVAIVGDEAAVRAVRRVTCEDESALTVDQIERTARALAALGWECDAEINAVSCRAKIELRRGDGRLLTLVVDETQASITREQIERTRVRTGRRGDRNNVERISVRFLGRDSFESAEHALRALADYAVDNSPAFQLEGRNHEPLSPV